MDDESEGHIHVRTSVNPADYMTDRMVADRCQRMYRLAQWKRLHEFCAKEPRAYAWTLQHIASQHGLAKPNERVVELFNRLGENRSPRTRVDLRAVSTAPSEPVTLEVDPRDVEDITPSIPKTPPAQSGRTRTTEALLMRFVLERDEGRFVDAARTLLEYLKAAPVQPNAQFPLMAVEIREVCSELAREGDFRLLVELCALLPSKLSASAIIDLGEKLKLGAHLHEAALQYQAAQRSRSSSAKAVDQRFMEAARRILSESE